MTSQWLSDNRILALGLGISVALLFTAINRSLEHIREAQKVEPAAPKPQYIDQGTEDALMPETLQVLVSSPNRSISTVASRIILDRAVHDKGTVREVLKQVRSEDVDLRERALRALLMLVSERALSDHYVRDIIKAVVVALKHNANEHQYDVYDQYTDTFGNRDDTERKALAILHYLMLDRPASGAAKILFKETRFVRKWLIRQNWGTTDEERKDNFAHFINTHKQSPSTLSIVLQKMCNYTACVKLLVEVGLLRQPEDIGLVNGEHGFTWSKEAAEREREGRAVVSIEIPQSFAEAAMEDPDAAMALLRGAAEEALRRGAAGETGTAHLTLGSLDASAIVGASARTIEQSEEERRLRRRNREVMVLNDGTQPFGADDIIEGTRTREGL